MRSGANGNEYDLGNGKVNNKDSLFIQTDGSVVTFVHQIVMR